MARVILVVDDNADMRMLMRMYLESEGLEVETSDSGVDAIHKLRQGLKPCLILLDMIMDKMSGEEFLNILESQYSEIFAHVPIIATSAMAQIPTAKVKGFLPKPVDVDMLMQTVEEHCGT